MKKNRLFGNLIIAFCLMMLFSSIVLLILKYTTLGIVLFATSIGLMVVISIISVLVERIIAKNAKIFLDNNDLEGCLEYLDKKDNAFIWNSIIQTIYQYKMTCYLKKDDIDKAKEIIGYYKNKRDKYYFYYYEIVIKIEENELDEARVLNEKFQNMKIKYFEVQRNTLRQIFKMIDNCEYDKEKITSTNFPVVKRIFEKYHKE